MTDAYGAVPDIGYLYDHVPLYLARQDVAFYLDEAKRSGGPVLEIGCGTGRILLPTARAGLSITGLDGSALMLERLRVNLARESAELRERVSVVQGDARDFSLGRKFALITAPFRVMQHSISIQDQLGVLASVARHLASGGRFIFDVFNPRFDLMITNRSEPIVDVALLTLPDGRRFERAARVPKVRWVDQVSEVELIYRLTTGNEPTREYVQAFDMRWFLPAEVVNLAARAGFRVEAVYGDMARGPVVDGCPDLIFVLTADG